MCAAKMEPKAHYTAKDFKRYARKEFPEQFATFHDMYGCHLENKTFLDENHTAHGVKVLLVGHCYARQGGPPVWAQATTTGVRYFSGKSVESVCSPIPERHVSRIYYDAPYNIVLGAHYGRSRTAGRKASHYFVETIINVLFLLAGQIEQVGNPGHTDMLGNFRYVCINYEQKPKIQDISNVSHSRQFEIPSPQNTSELVGREEKKRKRVCDDSSQRIKEEVIEENQLAQHITSNSPLPCKVASTPQASLFDQIRNYEADLHSKREQERQSYVEDIKALQAKVEEQEQRAQAAEEKAMRERKKRKHAEEQVANLQGQLASQEEKPVDSDVEEIETPESKRLSKQKKELTRLGLALEQRNRTIKGLKDELAGKKKC